MVNCTLYFFFMQSVVRLSWRDNTHRSTTAGYSSWTMYETQYTQLQVELPCLLNGARFYCPPRRPVEPVLRAAVEPDQLVARWPIGLAFLGRRLVLVGFIAAVLSCSFFHQSSTSLPSSFIFVSQRFVLVA